MRRRPDYALARIAGGAWAMREEALALLVRAAHTIATSGRTARRAARPAAVRSRQGGEALAEARRVSVADGIATIRVAGPLFHRDELLAWWFDGATYEGIARDLRHGLDARGVQAVVLEFDTPGGEVAGCDELAQIIRAAADEKPITALVIGDACSAGYWLASACGEIVAVPTARAGCLGVQVVYLDDTKFLDQLGFREIQIVSSQTPRKNAPPTEDTGRNDLQRMVDDLGAVMLGRIAEYRGVAPEGVAAQFGAGAVLVGERAREAGMLDRLTTSDACYAELAARAAAAAGSLAVPVAHTSSLHSLRTEHTMTVRTAGGAAAAPPTAPPAASGGTPETQAPTPPAAGATAGTAGAAGSGDAGVTLLATATPDQARAAFPVAAAALRAEGATAERERILGIEALAMPGHGAVIARCKADPACTPAQAALQLVAAEQAARGNHLAALRGDEAAITAPTPLDASATDATSEVAIARAILTAGPPASAAPRGQE